MFNDSFNIVCNFFSLKSIEEYSVCDRIALLPDMYRQRTVYVA